ncbi:MAG: biotin--[Alistipes sp.]|nr:biotin--[acetyl-CoA-carboxylase] ligase [Alistipes sp.]
MIHFFEQLTSSNDEARDARYAEGDIIVVEHQSAGRGQRGHSWESQRGLNLTLSAVFEPTFLPPMQQFLISEAVALAVVDTLHSFGIEAKIKWTNDIYVGDKKIAGILIEHKLQGNSLGRTIAGIGLNVNQIAFSPELPNPTSMQLEGGREFSRDEVLETLADRLSARYSELRDSDTKSLQNDYHQLLFRRDEMHPFALPDGSLINGIIRGVEPTGALVIEDEEQKCRAFLFKEIEFVLKK